MFPLNSNDQYIDSNGKRSKLGDAIGSGGGGDPYILPPATAERLGGVKIGNGVNVSEDGTISVSGGGSDKIHTYVIPFSSILGLAWNALPFTIPGTYDLTNCILSVNFGQFSTRVRLTAPFISSLNARNVSIDFYNQDSGGSVSGDVILTVQEP